MLKQRRWLLTKQYVGPGDVVSGALAWFSPARAYSRAYAASRGPVMDITTSSDTVLTTINILPTGYIDLFALHAWIATNGAASVKQIYDQTGNARHALNATTAQRPTITLNALNGMPALTGTAGANTNLTSSATFSQAQPYTYVAVAKRTAAFTTISNIIGSSGSNNGGLRFNAAANEIGATSDSVSVVTLTGVADDAFHAVQGIVNNTSTFASADGTDSSTGAGGVGAFSTNTVRIMRMAPGNSLSGQMLEGGLWPVALDASQRARLNSNMHGANGYNF